MTITITSTTVLAVSAVCFCLGCWRAVVRSFDETFETSVAVAFAGFSLVAFGFALARLLS